MAGTHFHELLFVQPVATCIFSCLGRSLIGTITLLAWLDDDDVAQRAFTMCVPMDVTLLRMLRHVARRATMQIFNIRMPDHYTPMQMIFLAIGTRRAQRSLVGMHRIVDFSSWSTQGLSLAMFHQWRDALCETADTTTATAVAAILDTIIRRQLRAMDANDLAHATLPVEAHLLSPMTTPDEIRSTLRLPVTKIHLQERFRGRDDAFHDMAVALVQTLHGTCDTSAIRDIVDVYLLPCVIEQHLSRAVQERIRLNVENILGKDIAAINNRGAWKIVVTFNILG